MPLAGAKKSFHFAEEPEDSLRTSGTRSFRPCFCPRNVNSAIISRNTLRNVVSRALATTVRRTSKRQKSRNSATEPLETRALLAVFTVTSTADTTAAGTLRSAIDQANTTPGDDEIKFDVATNGFEFDLGGTQFKITESLTITGNGATATVIDAQFNSRILDISGSAVNVSISGVTLKNGRVAGAGLQVGGAILFNSTGTLSISGSVLSANTVDDTTGTDAYGGAVFVQGGSLTVFGSTISGNTADWGGAIYANGNSDVSITSSTVDGNVASNDGGAIYAGFGGQGDVTITGSTLQNNQSQRRGGAITADNVTITGGSSVRLNSATTEGGAIHADGNVTVTNSTVSENTATTHGGAIHAGGNVTVTGISTMSDNTANGDGGAIFSIGSTEVTNSTLANNSTTGDNHRGGAIHSTSGAVTISQSTLSGNSTAGSDADGGAIFAISGTVTISQSTLSGNSTAGSSADGGAIHSITGALTISESTLSGNSTAGSSADGGAIYANTGAVSISQSTLSGNSTTGANAEGGAIFADTGALTISQSTLTLNDAKQSVGGAIFSFSSPVTITNSIVAGNTDLSGTAPDVRKSPNVDDAFIVTSSLIGRNNGTGLTATVGTTPGANGNLIGGDNAGAAINPQLGPLANNGGPTQTHALLSTSPAIDRGSNSLANDFFNDQRGNPFLRTSGDKVDMGAYERQTVAVLSLIVDTNQDENDGNYSAGDLSRREAIGLANGSIGTNTITFAASLFTGGLASTVLRLGELAISESVTINGPGQTLLSINANQLSRVLNVIGGTQIDVTLAGLTLTGGRTTASNASFSDNTHSGGGIRFDSTGTLTLTNSTVSENSTEGGSADGGGIFASTGAVTLTNSTVSGNSTAGAFADGGGISSASGAVTLTNSTVSGNQVTGTDSDGGGVRFDDSVVTIVNSTITGNSATGAGGGLGMLVDSSDKKLTIHNSIIAGNTAGSNPDFTSPTNPAANLEVRHSLIGRSDGTSLTASANPDANGNLIGGTTDPTKINPLLAPLANNGGPTRTHALLTNSPAFDRGSNALAVNVSNANSPLTTDQRGSNFLRIVAGTVDMGAIETRTPNGTSGNDAFVLTYSSTSTSGNVSVTVSSDGGPVINLGTFPMNASLTINGLGGTDSIRVVGTSGADTITVNSSTGLTVNGASLILTSIETRTLAGAAGSDVYRFDVDSILGLWTLDESGGGIETVDFSPTTTVGLVLNLATSGTQPVHATNLSLILGSAATIENVTGGSGADTLFGNGLDNTLTGGAGDDRLIGAGGSDLLLGGANNDRYDFFPTTVLEADQVTENANEGIDTLNFASLTTDVVVNLASTSIQPVHLNRTLKLNSATVFENLVGGSGADRLFGNSLDNNLTAGAGNDQLIGAGGNDVLLGGADNDTFVFVPATVAEADTVSENLNQGTDTLSFAFLTTNVIVNLGSTSVQPVHANRTLKLNSAVVFENILGGSGADTLFGNTLNNTLTGNAGDDKLLGSSGNDVLLGGANNDIYMFVPSNAAEADTVTENANEGIDTLNFAYLTTSVVVNLGSTSIQTVNLNRTLRLNSVSTFENAVGGTGSDTLLGNAVANRLTGGLGDNILVGLEGGDILEAGNGRDILIGGLGLDILKGDAGDDILIAGRTTSDTSLSNLNTLRTQWISANAYATRVANLRAGVGSPLVSLKATINVLNDAGEDDVLFGGTDTDWFFRAVDDVITDLFAGELIDVL